MISVVYQDSKHLQQNINLVSPALSVQIFVLYEWLRCACRVPEAHGLSYEQRDFWASHAPRTKHGLRLVIPDDNLKQRIAKFHSRIA